MGNGLRSNHRMATLRRHPMASEHTDSPGDPPSEGPRPTEGLHLQPLPPCSDPAFPVLHEYFEVVYGPLIGPASVLLARNLARHVTTAGGPVTLCPVELALQLGLRASHDEPVGKTSPLSKAIDRLAHHRLARHLDTNILGVVVYVPPLTATALGKLPDSIQRAHTRLLM